MTHREYSRGLFKPLKASPPTPYPLPAPPPLAQSRSLASNFLATISAALPLGARIMGTLPRVTTTLKSPRAILSDSASISTSVAEGELRMAYEGGASVSFGAGSLSFPDGRLATWFWFDPDASGSGTLFGNKENNEGLGTIKSRFWSQTPATLSPSAPDGSWLSKVLANSSIRGLGRDEVKER
jgi:hypothetical protein